MAAEDPAQQFFGEDEEVDLYAVLQLTDAASTDDIKKAYRKQALLHHPDRFSSASAEEQEEAKSRFQKVGFAYSVLSDPKRKERYDATGNTDEGFFEGKGEDFDWSEYFKTLWTGEVNSQTLDEFKKNYQGSEEERADILAAYVESEGSISTILDTVMCSTIDDEDRFVDIVSTALKSRQVPSFPTWSKGLKDAKAKEKRRKAAEKEAAEAEILAKELGVADKLKGSKGKGKGKGGKGKSKEGDDDEGEADEDALKALIQERGQQRMEALIDNLEAKYGSGAGSKKKKGKRAKGDDVEDEDDVEAPPKGSKRRKKTPEPTEEEFARIQAEVEARRNGSAAASKKGRKAKA